jgi:ribonucleoside-diphosphate reductase alpha chain
LDATTFEKPLKTSESELDFHALNAMLNLYDEAGKIQLDMDRLAAKQYFLQHVNQNTVFFHNLREKLVYLVVEGYYEQEVLDQYAFNFVRDLFDHAYDKKFRFPTFLGAFKYYTSYTLKTFDGKRYLERQPFSMRARSSVANWSRAFCCASRTIWKASADRSIRRSSFPSAAAAWRSR